MFLKKAVCFLLTGCLTATLCGSSLKAEPVPAGTSPKEQSLSLDNVSGALNGSSGDGQESSDIIVNETPLSSIDIQSSETPSSSQPEVKPEDVKLDVSGSHITRDTKYIATKEDLKEDPQNPSIRENQEEEQRDTGSAPPPPIVTPGDTSSSQPASSSDSQGGSSSQNTSSSSPDVSSSTPIVYSDGWQTIGGKVYYYKNNTPVTGWQTFSGRKYFFDGTGALSSSFGIDVSVWNGDIDWNAVKAAGVEYVYIRCGFRGWGSAGNMKLDPNYVKNITGANAAGINCGVYFFSQAITRAEAVEEAKFVLEAVKGYKVTLPLVFDTEYEPTAEARTNTANLTRANRTDFCIDFCNTIKSAGYYPMIYSSKSWYQDSMEPSRLSGYDVWLAHYTNQTDFKYAYNVWQYTSTGSVSGISGNVDLNVALFDYPSFIKNNGWNKLS